MPYLLASSLGDGEGGPEVSAVAVEQLLVGTGLPVGGDIVDCSTRPSLPVSPLGEAGSAVVNMPQLNAQGVPPAGWRTAVAERGFAYLVFTTPTLAQPAKPIEPEALAAFAGAEETLSAVAHVILPARSLR